MSKSSKRRASELVLLFSALCLSSSVQNTTQHNTSYQKRDVFLFRYMRLVQWPIIQGFHYMTLRKPGVSAELVQTRSALQARSHRHNLKPPHTRLKDTTEKAPPQLSTWDRKPIGFPKFYILFGIRNYRQSPNTRYYTASKRKDSRNTKQPVRVVSFHPLSSPFYSLSAKMRGHLATLTFFPSLYFLFGGEGILLCWDRKGGGKGLF